MPTNQERAATLIWQTFKDTPIDEIVALVDRLNQAELIAPDRDSRPEGLTLMTLTLRHYLSNGGDELVGVSSTSPSHGWMDIVKVLEAAKLLVVNKALHGNES